MEGGRALHREMDPELATSVSSLSTPVASLLSLPQLVDPNRASASSLSTPPHLDAAVVSRLLVAGAECCII